MLLAKIIHHIQLLNISINYNKVYLNIHIFISKQNKKIIHTTLNIVNTNDIFSVSFPSFGGSCTTTFVLDSPTVVSNPDTDINCFSFGFGVL